MNDIVTKFIDGGLPADPQQVEAFKAGVAKARMDAPATQGGAQFLKMQQAGMAMEGCLTYGADSTELQEGSHWVVNTFGIEHGWLLRDGGTVYNTVYSKITQPLPAANVLAQPVGNQQWRPAYRCQLICINGEDIGVQVEMSGDTLGIIKLLKNVLLPNIEGQTDVDASRMLPALSFEVTNYFSNKQKKKIYEAKGNIEHWYSNEELGALLAGVQTETAETQPEPRTAAVPPGAQAQTAAVPPGAQAQTAAAQATSQAVPPSPQPQQGPTKSAEPAPTDAPRNARRQRRGRTVAPQ